MDVAHHLCATQGRGPPRDNGDALRLLGTHGVLPEDLADAMRRAAGFRNVLIHDYAAVHDGIVHARLEAPADLQRFVVAVTEWIPLAG